MAYVFLADAFKQLQLDIYSESEKELDPSLKNDEDYITALIEVCEEVVSNDINCPLSDYVENDKLKVPLKHAILMMVRHMYDHRSPVDHQTAKEVALSYSHLIRPYRNIEI